MNVPFSFFLAGDNVSELTGEAGWLLPSVPPGLLFASMAHLELEQLSTLREDGLPGASLEAEVHE